MISFRTSVALMFISLASVTKAVLPDPLSDDFINLINTKQSLWKAGRNFHENTSFEYIKGLMGVLNDNESGTVVYLPVMMHDPDLIASLPENFDPRDKWPNCTSLNEIGDQGSCGSGWAFSAVQAMTDRVCTYSNGTQQFHFSAEDLLSCCSTCGGCEGGLPILAWNYWKDYGIVSGGPYNSSHGCRAYKFSPCEHHMPGKRKPCKSYEPTPKCERNCEAGYGVPYKKDKRYGKNIYTVKGEDHLKAELFKNGPVEGVFKLYSDFLNYKSGVYKHIHGVAMSGHSIKIMGWGVEKGVKYWLIANSWNSDWGENGFFKMLRGEDHCGIERFIVAGEPLIH